MIEVCHQVRGRLRLRVPDLRQEPGLAERIAAVLGQEPGIGEVRVNPACASLVVHYEPGTLNPTQIDARLRPLLPGKTPPLARDRVPPCRLPPTQPIALQTGHQRRGWRWLPAKPARLRALVAGNTRRTASPPLIYRLNLEMTRWVLTNSMRYWWYDLRYGAPPRQRQVQDRVASFLARLRQTLRRPRGLGLRGMTG